MIPLFIDGLRRGDPPIVHGDGAQSRDFTYVSDVVAANLAAAAAPASVCNGNPYNIAGGTSHSLLDLLHLLASILEVEATPTHTEPRAGDVRHTRADPSAAARDLGFKCDVDFDEGLRRTVEWFSGA